MTTNTNSSEANGESKDDPKVVVGACLLRPQNQFVRDLCKLYSTGHFKGISTPDACLLPHNRNRVIKEAYAEEPDFTHILFIDDDMCNFSAEQVGQMVYRDVDVVSGLAVKRKAPYKVVAHLEGSKVIECHNENMIVEVPYVGMAFTLIKREVLELTREETPEGPVWFTMDRIPRDGYQEELDSKLAELEVKIGSGEICPKVALQTMATFGEQAFLGSQLLGEDISFSHKVTKLGMRLWVDCGILVGHLGLKPRDLRDSVRHAEEKGNDIASISEISVVEPELSIVTN